MCALINIFLIALMIQSGLAIRCFNCDSSRNEKCTDLSDKSMVAEECTLDMLKQMEGLNKDDRRHWLLKLSEFSYLKSYSNPKMVCQKLVGTNENKFRMVVRRCQLEGIQACNTTRDKLEIGSRLEFCEECNTDGCNGSSNIQVYRMLIGVVTVLSIYMHFIL